MFAWLAQGATVAASLTAILGALLLAGRVAMAFSPFRRLVRWIGDGYREDREARIVAVLRSHLVDELNAALSFNGTGRFVDDMRCLDKRLLRIEDLLATDATVDEFARKGVIDRRESKPLIDDGSTP